MKRRGRGLFEESDAYDTIEFVMLCLSLWWYRDTHVSIKSSSVTKECSRTFHGYYYYAFTLVTARNEILHCDAYYNFNHCNWGSLLHVSATFNHQSAILSGLLQCAPLLDKVRHPSANIIGVRNHCGFNVRRREQTSARVTTVFRSLQTSKISKLKRLNSRTSMMRNLQDEVRPPPTHYRVL